MISDASAYFSPKAQGVAVGAAFLLYTLFALFVFFTGDQSLERMESMLAAEVIDAPYASPTLDMREDDIQQPQREASDLNDKPDAPLTRPHGSIEHSSSPKDHGHASEGQDESSQVSQSENLLPAPFDGMTEESEFGLLPAVSPRGLTPFHAYKKPFVVDTDRPALAFAVHVQSASGNLFDAALNALPDSVSIILSPYLENIEALQAKARAAGHEVWLELPMETAEFPGKSPGPKGILSHAGLRFNKDNLEWVLTRAVGYAGIAAFKDETFASVESMIKGVFEEALSRGLGYFELNNRSDRFSESLARQHDSPFVKNTSPVSSVYDDPSQSLSLLQNSASFQQRAVGVIPLTPAMLEYFDPWLASIKEERVQIVPLSALASQE